MQEVGQPSANVPKSSSMCLSSRVTPGDSQGGQNIPRAMKEDKS